MGILNRHTKVLMLMAFFSLTVFVISIPAFSASLSTDQYSSIQEAIDAAEPGDIIKVEPGTYKENLFIYKDLTLTGVGKNKVKIVSAERGLPVMLIGPTGYYIPANNSEVEVEVSKINISGAEGYCLADENRICPNGVSITGEAQVKITETIIEDHIYEGIVLHDSSKAVVRDSTITENKNGIELNDSAQIKVTGSVVLDNGNTTSDYNNNGIKLHDSSKAVVRDSTISDNRVGIRLNYSSRAKVTGSKITGNEYHAIELDDTSQAMITESTMSNMHSSGILLQNSSKVNVNDSIISEAAIGFKLHESTQATITNSTISGNYQEGIKLQDSSRAVVKNNKIKGNNEAGIISFSEKKVVGENNELKDNGVGLVGNVSSSLRKPLTAESKEEIYFPSEEYPTLQHAVDAVLPAGTIHIRELDHNLKKTIVLGKKVTIKAQTENRLTLKGDVMSAFSLVKGAELKIHGLKLAGYKDGLILGPNAKATVTDSLISDNEENGIELHDSSQITIKESGITGNKYGFYFQDTSKGTIINCILEDNLSGMSLSESSFAKVISSTLAKNSSYAIHLADSSRSDIISSKIFDNGTGVNPNDSSQITLENNVFKHNDYGIEIYEHGPEFKGDLKGFGNEFVKNNVSFENVPKKVKQALIVKKEDPTFRYIIREGTLPAYTNSEGKSTYKVWLDDRTNYTVSVSSTSSGDWKFEVFGPKGEVPELQKTNKGSTSFEATTSTLDNSGYRTIKIKGPSNTLFNLTLKTEPLSQSQEFSPGRVLNTYELKESALSVSGTDWKANLGRRFVEIPKGGGTIGKVKVSGPKQFTVSKSEDLRLKVDLNNPKVSLPGEDKVYSPSRPLSFIPKMGGFEDLIVGPNYGSKIYLSYPEAAHIELVDLKLFDKDGNQMETSQSFWEDLIDKVAKGGISSFLP
ncbi:MAG: right-handed parallel beta-helix repeat-containing protein, partial [Candidatus Bipolaricaulia bacterium]